MILFIAALFLAAFFSGSETALTTARKIQIEVWIKQGLRGASHALRFLEHPEHFLTTTLVGTNIAVVAASSTMAYMLESKLSGVLITAISASIILFFGEILPKSIARERAGRYSVKATPFLHFFYILLYPVITVILFISKFFLRILGMESGSVSQFFSRKDLELLVRETEKTGEVDIEQRGLISRLILRGNRKVREIMIPRTAITALPLQEKPASAADFFMKTGYSRIPVYETDIDEIAGMITAKDILLKKPRSLKTILRPVHFTPETRMIAGLLREMQDKRTHLAIVVDEYGGTAGMVTLEDIVEEFFGEIQDEHDEDLALYRNINLKRIDVNASAHVSELNERLRLNLPSGEYLTLGGFLMEKMGRIPKPGEKLELEECDIRIRSVSHKRIGWVRFILKGNREIRDFQPVHTQTRNSTGEAGQTAVGKKE